ncbi:hypothetical protein ACLOJK_037878 [Asimina triloba]
METFNKALEKGEGFSVDSRVCIHSSMSSFDDGCADAAIELANWDSSKVRDKLQRDIDAHVDTVRTAKLHELRAQYEGQLNAALAEPMVGLLDGASHDTWPAIKMLLERESASALSGFSNALSGFEIDQTTMEKMVKGLEEYARNIVETKAREEAGRVLIRMKERFSTVFSHDSDSIPRVWTGNEDIRAITKTAHSASLKLLSVLAAIRLDDKADKIETTLSASLLDSAKRNAADRGIASSDLLASSTWEEVPPAKTLISPAQCKSLWRQFRIETEYTITQALATQMSLYHIVPPYCTVESPSSKEAHKNSNNWLPPPWAMVAIAVLGFNELMTLLRNPFYLGVIFVAYLMFKAFWAQLDVSDAFSNGFVSTTHLWPLGHKVPGLLALSARFVPTVMNILTRLANVGRQPTSTEPQRNPAIESRSLQSGTYNEPTAENFKNSSCGDLGSTSSSNSMSLESGMENSSSLH